MGVTAIILAITLIRTPIFYRQVLTNLSNVQTLVVNNHSDLGNLPPAEITNLLKRYDQEYDVRLLVFDQNRQLIADSRQGTTPAVEGLRRFQLLVDSNILRDENGGYWLYSVARLRNNLTLITAAPRPQVRILSLFRDELFGPFIQAGLIALVLSLFVAFWLAHWISNPLQQIIRASRQMPAASSLKLSASGPREVQALTKAFNEMSTRVSTSQKSQRDFVANVSHELKTPLTSIQGFAQAILDGTAETIEERQQAATIIFNESGRMHKLVLDLLDLARLDAGTLELQRAPVDLAALLRAMAERFSLQARSAGVVIQIEANHLPVITGDGDRLAQVFTNLVDNALKFTPAGGRITLQAEKSDSYLQITVSDTGAGIPTEAVARIFDRFYQVDPARPGGEKHGSGLGLAIVKEIVTAHGGTISARSEPGQGSVFTIRLPIILSTDTTLTASKK